MKKKTMKRIVAAGLALGLVASVGIGAYLTDTDVKSDVYTVGNVQAEIVSNGDMEVANAGYLLPGTVHQYERAATNTGINDAYVFMSVTIPYETVGVADDSGAQLGEKVMQLFTPGTINSEWKLVDDGFIGEYEIVANGQAAGEHDAYSVIAGNTITYVYGYIGDNADGALKALASGETTSNLLEELKLTNLYNASKIDGEVSTKLYAIQSANINGGLTDVNGVWAVINKALVADATVQAPVFDDADVYFYNATLNRGTGDIQLAPNDGKTVDAVIRTVAPEYMGIEDADPLIMRGDQVTITLTVKNDSDFDVILELTHLNDNPDHFAVSIDNSQAIIPAGGSIDVTATVELLTIPTEYIEAALIFNLHANQMD